MPTSLKLLRWSVRGGAVCFTCAILVVVYHKVSLNRLDQLPLTCTSKATRGSTVVCESGRPYTYGDRVDLRIIAITFNRATSLLKLLRSLDPLELDGRSAALEIWIDRNRKTGAVDERTVKAATGFEWRGGPNRVHVQTAHVGIYGQWIDTWRPPDDSDDELGLILEDDVVVSKYAYRWMRAVFRAYGRRTDFAGASLQSDRMQILSTRVKGQLAGPENDTVFMYKCLGSWGFAPKPLHWRRFQTWYHLHKPSVVPHFRPYVPGALPTTWYKKFERAGTAGNMWTMWFIYYLHIEQLYTVYNNLGVYTGNNESCLTINRLEVGLHVKQKGPENHCKLLSVWKDEYIVFPNNTARLHWDGTDMGNLSY